MSFVLNLHVSYYFQLNELVVVYILKTAANHDHVTCRGIAVNHDPTTRLQVELSFSLIVTETKQADCSERSVSAFCLHF